MGPLPWLIVPEANTMGAGASMCALRYTAGTHESEADTRTDIAHDAGPAKDRNRGHRDDQRVPQGARARA
ncbi:hypothetical protein ACSTK4_23555, partial [Vibrio parahaemolyticus]